MKALSPAASRAGTTQSRSLVPAARRALGSPIGLKLVAGFVILAAWEILVRAAAKDFVARPSTVAVAIPAVLGDATFRAAARSTIVSVVVGLAISLASGSVVGLAMGRLRPVDWSLRYHIAFLYAVPMTAIVPLLSLWFGFDADARLATVVFASFLTIVMNVSDGAKSVPLEYLEVARSFRAKWYHVLFGVTLPSAVPYLFAGIRLAAGRALVAATVAELISSIDGLGLYILYNSRTYQHARAFVAVLLLAVVAVGIEVGMNWATRRFLHHAGGRNP